MRLFIFLSISIFAAGFAVLAHDEDIPYIYYHSEALNAIVIERADGSDSRAIAHDLMPENHEIISGPGWSPSGKWLARTSAYATEYYPGPEQIWVMSADGEQRLTILDSIADVMHASWSPTSDYLLVIEQYQNGSYPVWLVDVTDQRIIATFDDLIIELGARPQFWSADGNSVQFGYPEIRVVHIDGKVEENIPAELRPPLAERPELRMFLPETISPDGMHEFISSPSTSIHRIETNISIPLRPFSGGAGGICGIDWSPNSNWLLVSFSMTWAGGGCSRAGTSIVRIDGRIQRELGPCHLRDNCANWLPDRVLEHLGLGQPTSVVPDPLLTLEHEGWVRGVSWHPEGTHLATYSERRSDNSSYLNIWNVDASPPELIQTYFIEKCVDATFTSCTIIWNNSQTQIGLTGRSGTQIVDLATNEITLVTDDYLLGFDENDTPTPVVNSYDIAYSPETKQMARPDWQNYTIEIYSQNDDETTYQLEPDKISFAYLEAVTFVPDSNYLAFIGNPDEPVQGNFLWDLNSGEVKVLPKYGLEYLTDIVAFDPQTIIGYGRGSLLYFWDIETKSVKARLNRYAFAVDVTPDLIWMATGSGYMVEIWNYQTIVDQLSGQ